MTKKIDIPITQSELWQTLQHDLGEKSHLKSGEGFHYLAIEKHTPAGNYLYLPYGPVVASESGFSRALVSLASLGMASRAIFIRIEPQFAPAAGILTTPSFALPSAIRSVQKVKDLSPKETWQLDLTGSADDLKSRLPSRLLRYHKNRESHDITITTSHNPADIHYLLDLQRALAEKKHIKTFSEHYLATELSQPFATLYIVKQGTTPIAAGLVFDDASTRYNLQGAQSDAGRRLHATGILTIQLILDAAAKHLRTFDFWGIAPDGATATHPWAGFTAFKKTFAGIEKDYAGTYDLILRPLRYRLFNAIKRARH